MKPLSIRDHGDGPLQPSDRRNGPIGAAVMLSFLLVMAGCTSAADSGAADGRSPAATAETDQSGASATDGDENTTEETDEEQIELTARPGPFQLTIDSKPAEVATSATIEAYRGDTLLATANFEESGSAILRELPEGPVEIVLIDDESRRRFRTEPMVIPGETIDDQSIYGRTELVGGLNYIPTRDGTTLSAFVTLPGSVEGGPYPTLVEYSGYSPSDPTATDDPYRLLIPALGYALVQVNVRGTGCSGGSFDAFERIQSLDGYDVIETVAAQAWSEKVGMFGVSYPGIMQLHVASTKPPSLAAIAPLSVTDGVDSVLYPGGVYNDGFGEEWTRLVGERAEANGQAWAATLSSDGDQTCAANQSLRVHNPDLVEVVKATPYLNDLTRQRSARTHAGDIIVPTFIGGAWQDEQTGGRFPALLEELTAVPVLRAVLYNGLHIDAISGEMLVRLIDFFNLYVGDQPPKIEPITRLLVGVGLSALFGEALTIPASRYEGMTAAEARTVYESEPPIEVLFEQGAEQANLPVPAFTADFSHWPPAETEATELYFTGNAGGAVLGAGQPTEPLELAFTTDPAEGQLTTSEDLDRIWTNQPNWVWPAPSSQNSIVAATEPLDDDLLLVGNLSADLWISVSDPDGSAEPLDAEIEVTVSEIAPDGSETYVQAGWLRLSQRAQSSDATELRAAISGLESDRSPLTADEPVLARVEVLPFAHVFRAGSRLKITVDTPGASRPQWRFAVAQKPVEVTVHSSPAQPSRLVLPVIPGFDVPTGRPDCGTLRGQPCRAG